MSSSLTSNENISDSLEGEITFHDISSELEDISCDELVSWVNGEQPLSSMQSSIVYPLPELNFPLSFVTLNEMVKKYGFNHKLSYLEEVYVEQPAAKFHTYYHNN